MAVFLLMLGAAATISGFALLAWPLGLMAAGVLMLLAGIDLRR